MFSWNTIRNFVEHVKFMLDGEVEGLEIFYPLGMKSVELMLALVYLSALRSEWRMNLFAAKKWH